MKKGQEKIEINLEKKFTYGLQTTEILLMASILSICKIMPYYIGICISNIGNKIGNFWK